MESVRSPLTNLRDDLNVHVIAIKLSFSRGILVIAPSLSAIIAKLISVNVAT